MVSHKIFNDWKGAFPFLKEYTKSTLYLRAGIVMLGLRLESSNFDSNTYLIYLECRSLWENKNSLCESFVFYYYLRSKGNIQFWIFDNHHDFYFPKVLQRVKDQFGGILEEKIRLSSLFNVINQITVSFDCNILSIFEFELALSIYLNDPEMEARIWRQIDMKFRHFKKKDFLIIHGITIEEWKQDLYERMSDREALMAQVEKNLESRRIRNLNEAQFVIDDFVLDSEQPKSMSRRWKEFRENFRNTRIGLWRQLIAKIKGEEYP